jgi:AcrR family transcriptional regulator
LFRIAAAAGLSIGALYRFFPDKQTIIDAIAVHHTSQFRILTSAPSPSAATSAPPPGSARRHPTPACPRCSRIS